MVTDIGGRVGRDGKLKRHGYHSENLHTATARVTQVKVKCQKEEKGRRQNMSLKGIPRN
jgi:hypothetical protein